MPDPTTREAAGLELPRLDGYGSEWPEVVRDVHAALLAAGYSLAGPGDVVVPAPPSLDDLPRYCDWSCRSLDQSCFSRDPVAWRWYGGQLYGGEWLPVCAEHADSAADEGGLISERREATPSPESGGDG